MLLLITILVGIIAFVSIFMLLRFLGARRLKVVQRLDIYGNELEQHACDQSVKQGPNWEKLLNTFGRPLTSVTPNKFVNWLNKQLIYAGVPLRGEEYITLSLGVGLLVGILLFVISIDMSKAWLGVVMGCATPIFILHLKQKSRLRSFNSQLGDVLLFLSNAMKAGHSFMQALQLAADETQPPISQEFARVLRETSLGVSTEQALVNMGKRVPSEDLDLVITAVLIQRQVGGNLAEILEGISATIRDRFRIRREVKSLTAQGRLSGMLIGLLPALVGGALLMINPQYISLLFTHPLGLMMLGIAITGEFIGLLVIKKIVNIEV